MPAPNFRVRKAGETRMTLAEETAMHDLAVKLAQLTSGVGWTAMKYAAIGKTMERLAEYCAVCDCQRQPSLKK